MTKSPETDPQYSFKAPKAIRIFGASIILKHLDVIIKETSGIYSADDIEYIHRTRVAARRLRTALDAFEPYFSKKSIQSWKKTIRRIARLLSSARDTDVQIAELSEFVEQLQNEQFKPGLDRLILRLKQRRHKMQARLVSRLKKTQRQKSLTEIRDTLRPLARHRAKLTHYPHELYSRAEETIIYQLNIMLYHQYHTSQPARAKELHAVRLIAKELRYLMELFNPIYDDQLDPFIKIARETQDLAGQIRSCDLWLDYLARFLKSEQKKILKFQGDTAGYSELVPGIQHFQQLKQQEREEIHARFLKLWKQWNDEQQWNNIRQALYDFDNPMIKA